MLDINAVKRYKFHLIIPVDLEDCSAFFVPGGLDPRNTIVAKLKEFGVTINPEHLVYKQHSEVEGVYTISLYATFTIGTLREVSAAIPINENLDVVSNGHIFPYRVVFLLPEGDTCPRLLTYAQDLNTATRYVADVENNEFGVKVYFEKNPYYDENATLETALSLWKDLVEE